MVNGNPNHHYILMENNIIVSSLIGHNLTNRAHGILNGAGRTIHLAITSSNTHVGLFGVAGSLDIRNLYLTGNVTFTGSTGGNTGALIGHVPSGSWAVITDVDSSANVTGRADTGGLVGSAVFSNTAITNCTVRGNVSGSTGVGGIAGYSNANIVRCSVRGNVEGSGNNVGGIVGFVSSGNSRITECEMLGNVTGWGSNTGGIVGHHVGQQVDNCRVTGRVQGNASYTDGIIGTNVNSSSRIAENCYVSGTVSGNQSTSGITGRQGIVRGCFMLGNPGTLVERRSTGGTAPGRINNVQATRSNNRASNNVILRDRVNNLTPSSGLTTKDGETLNDALLRGNSQWFIAAGWNFTSIWAVSAGQYPILQNTGARIVNSVTISPWWGANIWVTDKIQLTATVLPANAPDRRVTWISDNPAAATVDANGLVTGVSLGWAWITARSVSSPNVSATALVHVMDIGIYPEELIIEKGDEYNLGVWNIPGSISPDDLIWEVTSSNPADITNPATVVSLSDSDHSVYSEFSKTVTGNIAGTADIAVSFNYNGYIYKKTHTVTVVEMELNYTSKYLNLNDPSANSFTLKFSYAPPDAAITDIHFEFVDPDNAIYVDDLTHDEGEVSALITGANPGTAVVEVWVRLNDWESEQKFLWGTCTVTVVKLVTVSDVIGPTLPQYPNHDAEILITNTVEPAGLNAGFVWYDRNNFWSDWWGNEIAMLTYDGVFTQVIVDIDTPDSGNTTGIRLGVKVTFTISDGLTVVYLTAAEIAAIIA
jgi:hypothetical protein